MSCCEGLGSNYTSPKGYAMQTRTINIYEYHELDDTAKEAARDWLRGCIAADPAWWNEHRQSWLWAIDQLDKVTRGTLTVSACILSADACEGTGYCADAILADFLRTGDTSGAVLKKRYGSAWKEESAAQCEDSAIVESIAGNEYTFDVHGKRLD